MKAIISIISLSLLSISLSSCNKEIENINKDASIHSLGDLPENPLLLIPITFSISPGDNTMSTLYGNRIASDHAKLISDPNYPVGSVLYEVNWKQKPDPVWFGGNIPKEIVSIERVSFLFGKTPGYERFVGDSPGKESLDLDKVAGRLKFIISQKRAILP